MGMYTDEQLREMRESCAGCGLHIVGVPLDQKLDGIGDPRSFCRGCGGTAPRRPTMLADLPGCDQCGKAYRPSLCADCRAENDEALREDQQRGGRNARGLE